MIAFSNRAYSQDYFFGVHLGPMYYHGDLTEPLTVSPGKFSGGIFFGRKINGIVSATSGFTWGRIAGSDHWAYSSSRIERNLSFASDIRELDFQCQIDVQSWLLPSLNKYKLSLLVAAGVSYFWFKPEVFYQNRWFDLHDVGTEGQHIKGYEKNVYSLHQVALPWGLSLQHELNKRFTSGLKFNHRILFTDYLDDVSTVYIHENEFHMAGQNFAAFLSNRMGENSDRRVEIETGQPRGDNKKRDGFYQLSLYVQYNFGK